MNPQRRSAILLMIFLGLFAAGVVVQMARINLREKKQGVLAVTELSRLKDDIKNDPQNEAAIKRARQIDLVMREDYFRTHRQYQIAAYLLLAAIIGFLLSANMFLESGPPTLPDVATLGKGLERAVLARRARHGALAVTGISILALAGFASLGIVHRNDIPVVIQGTRGEGREASISTTSTLANASTSATLSGAGRMPALQTTSTTPMPTHEAATSSSAPMAPTAVASAEYKENWPCLRGPGNIGIRGAGEYPTAWSFKDKSNIAWMTPVPAEGKGSPIVWGDKVFLTGGSKTEHRVLAFERATGKLLWDTKLEVPAVAAMLEIYEDTGFAASTPATDGQRVFALFASGLLAAVDMNGQKVWAKDLGTTDSQYGLASSLIVHDGTLIALLDQGPEAEAQKSRIAGFDAATGKEKWSTARPVPNSWASPSIIKTPARAEAITCANPFVIAYDPAGGKELWRMDGYGGEIAPSPAFDGERIIVSNDSAATYAIKPGGSGDITETGVLWKNEDDGQPDISSPLASGGRVLLVRSAGEFLCLNAADGKRIWEKSLDCSFTASPILAGKYVYQCGQDGATRIFELGGTEYKEAGKGEVGEPVDATPAFADGRIYIRGSKHLFCIGAKP